MGKWPDPIYASCVDLIYIIISFSAVWRMNGLGGGGNKGGSRETRETSLVLKWIT